MLQPRRSGHVIVTRPVPSSHGSPGCLHCRRACHDGTGNGAKTGPSQLRQHKRSFFCAECKTQFGEEIKSKRQTMTKLGGCQRLLLACLCVGLSGAFFTPATAATQPNILLLFPDQWRYDWGGSLWNVPLHTPNFDSVVSRGTAFKRAYVASPLCAPSRGCLAAGKEYDEAGVPSNFANDFPPNQTTFYQLLRGEGASCCYWWKHDIFLRDKKIDRMVNMRQGRGAEDK